jgi:hypothetical protein
MASEPNAAKAIYYPYIEVPNSPWFTRVLLYWDEVGAIVPYQFIENPDKLGPYMVGLVREQLVHQVMPGAYLWQLRNFDDAFLTYVDQQHWDARSAVGEWPNVHMEKLQSLGEKLRERGLARGDKVNRHSPWYEVEPRTANAFMAYLAGVLGQFPSLCFSPITDEPQSLTPFLDERSHRKAPIRRLVLDGLLPSPSGEVNPGALADFKSKHRRSLRAFRRDVEDKISELTHIADENELNQRIQDVVANMRDHIDELSARMREERNWPKVGFGTLCAIVGAGVSACQALANADYTLGISGAALSVAPAIFDAFRGTEWGLEDKPLAYAALASAAVT